MLTAGWGCEIKLAYMCTKYLYICTKIIVHLYQQFCPTSSWPPVTIQPLVDLAAFSRPCLKCSQMSWDTLKLLAPPITDIKRPGEKRVNPRNKETLERARNCFQLWSAYKKPWKSSTELPMFSGWIHLYKRPRLLTKCFNNHKQQTDLWRH